MNSGSDDMAKKNLKVTINTNNLMNTKMSLT